MEAFYNGFEKVAEEDKKKHSVGKGALVGGGLGAAAAAPVGYFLSGLNFPATHYGSSKKIKEALKSKALRKYLLPAMAIGGAGGAVTGAGVQALRNKSSYK